jgi:hypothetical protein
MKEYRTVSRNESMIWNDTTYYCTRAHTHTHTHIISMEVFSLRSTTHNASIGLSLIKFEFQKKKLKRVNA